MKNLLHSLVAVIAICFAMPAIATPPDSPPKAPPAIENTNAIEAVNLQFAPALAEYAAPVDMAVPIRASILVDYGVAILTHAIERPSAVYQRSTKFRLGTSLEQPSIRTMTTAPPESC